MLRAVGLSVTSIAGIQPVDESELQKWEQGNERGDEHESTMALGLGNRRRGFLSKALKAMRAKDKEQLMLALDKRSQSRLHSCGGPVSGLFLTQTPDQPELRMQDDEFITAAQWRLGALTPHSDAKCRLRDAEDRICNQAMDNHCDHGATCKVGRGVLRTHNAVV